MLENVDTYTYGDKKYDHVIRYRVKHIIDMFFKDENVAFQAHILRSLLTSKKLKEDSTLLGIRKSTKDKIMKENVIQNINSAINWIRRSRQKKVLVVCREIHMAVVSSSTKENCMVKSMARALGTSRKTLHKHQKFRLQINVNVGELFVGNPTNIDLKKMLKK